MSSQSPRRRIAPTTVREGLYHGGWLVIGRVGVNACVERPLTIAARSDEELRRRNRRSHVLLIPLCDINPRGNVVWINGSQWRVVLTGAIGVVAKTPASLFWIVGECHALGNPGIELRFVVIEIEVRHIGEKSLRLLNARLCESRRNRRHRLPMAVPRIEVNRGLRSGFQFANRGVCLWV